MDRCPHPDYPVDLTRRTPRWDVGHQPVLKAPPVLPRRRQGGVDESPVRARLVRERDGEEWLGTVAFAAAAT